MASCKLLRFCALLSAASWSTIPGFASEITYRPINPSFGGNPLYSSHLLGTAQAQNGFRDNSQSAASFRPSTADDFRDRITSVLISRVASEIGEQILGENARQSGTFQLDATTINFQRVGDQVRIQINDSATGGSSVITVPAPVF